MTEGKCPSCGAQVQFTAGSARVLVCGSCSTVVARTDHGFEAHGRAVAIVDTDSPLSVGLDGRHAGSGFRIIGRLQKDHGAGPWDEWYLAFDDGREAWLSESEGAWHFMFPAGTLDTYPLERLAPGSRLTLRDRPFVVEELGTATTLTAEGQLPSELDPGVAHRYADVTGQKGAFATLDYGSGDQLAELFIGQRVRLEEMGFDPNALAPRVRKINLQAARCSQCNGPLELKAPDAAQRVGCPYCGALLDCSQGKLAFLQQLEKPDHIAWVPLGAKGKIFGVEWTCLAFLVRSCTVEGTRYPWDEFLLWNRDEGFRWLILSNGHWSFLTPIPAGEVAPAPRAVIYEGHRYRLFQEVGATTEYVQGECYWKVEPGEYATATEWVSPPLSINRDQTEHEVTFTVGHYLEPEVVQEAFKLPRVPVRQGIASAQPNLHREKAFAGLKWAGAYSAALFVLYFVFLAVASNRQVWQGAISVPMNAQSGSPEAMFFSEPFEVPSSGNVEISATASPLNNDWAGLEVDLVNEATGEVVGSYLEMSYFHGRDSDGSWSEGSTADTTFLSTVDKGRYVARFVPYFGGARPTYNIGIRSDVPRFLWVLVGWVLLFTAPLIRVIRSSQFETTRWAESTVGE